MLSGETFLEAFAKLKNHGAWTLVCHEHPDGDTLGSAFALYSLAKRCGKRAAIVSKDPLPPVFSFFPIFGRARLRVIRAAFARRGSSADCGGYEHGGAFGR